MTPLREFTFVKATRFQKKGEGSENQANFSRFQICYQKAIKCQFERQ